MKTVQVFLSTYNGEKYIKEQIESLLAQKEVKVSILVRDDGSKDHTVDVLRDYEKQGAIKLHVGKNIGYAKSFLDLVAQAVEADYYAFCDQDDVWLPEKLMAAVQMIEKSDYDPSKPILYASALQRVDTYLKPLPLQDFKNLKLTLGAEFTRHRLAGCSFVFNSPLRDLLRRADDIKCSHDKLATILCMACGGKVLFDKKSYILFRRHGNNESADGIGTREKIKKDVKHYFGHQNDVGRLARSLLQQYVKELTPKAALFLAQLAGYKKNSLRTVRLALSTEIDCGFWYFNLFVRMMILCRLF